MDPIKPSLLNFICTPYPSGQRYDRSHHTLCTCYCISVIIPPYFCLTFACHRLLDVPTSPILCLFSISSLFIMSLVNVPISPDQICLLLHCMATLTTPHPLFIARWCSGIPSYQFFGVNWTGFLVSWGAQRAYEFTSASVHSEVQPKASRRALAAMWIWRLRPGPTTCRSRQASQNQAASRTLGG